MAAFPAFHSLETVACLKVCALDTVTPTTRDLPRAKRSEMATLVWSRSLKGVRITLI